MLLTKLVWLIFLSYCASQVILNDNGYEGVVISIEESINSANCQDIVQGLENLVRDTSGVVFETTRQRAYFKEVTVLVPSTWSPVQCPLLLGKLKSANHESHSSSDIRITLENSNKFGSRPWTVQSKGCAKQGDYISFSHNLLFDNQTKKNSRLLAQNWIRYRYGLFDEVSNGHQYPSTYRGEHGDWEYSVCSNVAIQEEKPCKKEELSCPRTLPLIKRPDLSGSFMTFPELETVKELCDEGTHNPIAPTPHNTICDSKSSWEVLRASPDFQNNRNVEGRALRGKTTFKYVQQKPPRMVLLIEATSIMNMQKRWDFMRKAIRKMVHYDIPKGLRVGLVVFDSHAVTKYPMTPLIDDDTRLNLGSSLPRNPSNEDKHNRCISCGIKNSLKLLRQNGGTSGGHIVLTVGGSGRINEEEERKIRKLLAGTNVILHVIVYPLTDKFPEPNSGIESLASRTGGLTFTIEDEGIGADSKIVMYYNLLDALYNTLLAAAGENLLPVKIHSSEHEGGLLQNSEGSFWLDPGLGSNTVFEVFYYDLGHVGDKIHLTSPHGQVIDTDNMQREDDNMNMITIRLDKNQEIHGLWKYKLENRANSHQSLFVQVTSRPKSRSEGLNLNVRSWTSHEREVNITDISKPLAIFAEVRANLDPVVDAKVIVVLTRLGFSANGTEHEPIKFQLFDNGLLSPDVQINDGIYSRYVTGLSQGKYTAKVLIEGQVEEFRFTRQLLLASINVVGHVSFQDTIPPSRITDLKANVIPDSKNEVFFTWTAPGDNFDYGQAGRYEVFVSDSFSNLKDGSGEKISGFPEPLPGLSSQQHTITWKEHSKVFYFAVRAVDYNGNIGPISNIVDVYIQAPTIPKPSTVVTYPEIIENAEPSVFEGSSFSNFSTQHWIILSCVAFGIILVLVAAVYFTTKTKAKKGLIEKKPDNLSVTVTIGNDFDKEKTYSNESVKKDYLTPITSWSPSELLANHHSKRNSLSGRSDNNSDHSGSTKKSYGGSCEPPQYYATGMSFPDGYGYSDSYIIPTDGYPTPTENNQNPYQFSDGYIENIPPEIRSYVGSHPSESFLSESCDILPGSQGPPGYSAYPTYEGSLRGTKVPPPIPPKPKVAYTPEPSLYDNHEYSSNNSSSSTSMASEKRIRNVTMV